MLYYIFRPLARIALLIFFKKIYISGKDNLPGKECAVILACNHPNGFLEPIILACFLRFPLHFLVRGDLFKNKLLKPILIGTNQIPVFRFKDGFAALKNNMETMQDSLRIIGEKKALLIYPEGSTHQTIYLRPIKKGTARLALQAKAQFDDLPIKLIPVGVNYTNPNAYRSRVMIEIGEAIDIQLQADTEMAFNKQIMELTDTLENSMQKLVKQVALPEYEKSVIQLLNINSGFKRVTSLPILRRSNKLLKEEQLLVSQFNALENKDMVTNKIEGFYKWLGQHKIRRVMPPRTIPGMLGDVLLLLLMFPVATLAFLVHVLPVYFIKWLIRKYVKYVEFRTSVLTAGSAGIIMFYYIILSIIFLFIDPELILCLPFLLVSLFFFSFCYDLILDLSVQWKLTFLGKAKRKQMYAQAQEIIDMVAANNLTYK